MTNCVNSVRAQIYLINVCTCKIRYSVSFLAACGNRGYEDVKSNKDINVAKFFILDFHVEKHQNFVYFHYFDEFSPCFSHEALRLR